MKKTNKKGFTIVELVIVIAVIAILAAVLIPTFSNVIESANESSAMQAAKNEYTNFMATLGGKIGTGNYIIESKQGSTTYYFLVVEGQFNKEAVATAEANATAPTLTLNGTTYTKDSSASDLTTSIEDGNSNVAIFAATTTTSNTTNP